jgi:glucan 1,4-alpha-glucosidase
MKYTLNIIASILLLFSYSSFAQQLELSSPSGNIVLSFIIEEGKPFYSLNYKNEAVVKTSSLGFRLKDGQNLEENFIIEDSMIRSADTTWEQVWGEERFVRDNYNELFVSLRQNAAPYRKLNIIFRTYDDGAAFRYEFPSQGELNYFIISDELTEFALTGDHKCFWIPGDYDSQEYTYTTSALSRINALLGINVTEIGVKTIANDSLVQSPLMLKTSGGLYINISEAALLNFPAMHLEVNRSNYKLKSHLVPDALGNKAYLQTPEVTPWRVIMISDKAEDLLASRLVLNLNDPPQIEDTDWIIPRKYIGIWWEMHAGVSSWSYSDLSNIRYEEIDWDTVKASGNHGATTKRTKEYIDFAAEHGFDAVLVEGWNVGWEDWYGAWKENVFDFVTPYPDYDPSELSSYAASKGVKLIMHHETSASVTNYEFRIDEAFRFMKQYGYDAVKTGYVGRIIPRGEHHDGQWMVNHYTRTLKKAADMKIMVNSHESVRPTGLHRTYPNWISSEAARGNEFNAWSKGNPPEHETILPFTRLIGGPMDYTPGIFRMKMNHYDAEKGEQVHTTLAKQLALFVTMYSPLQMAADIPENYDFYPDAFRFIKDVPVDWEETRIIAAEPGDYIIIARKEKGGANWFIGAVTDEKARTFTIKLDFIQDGETYIAEIYEDADDAHWEDNPEAYRISKKRVNNKNSIELKLAPGGGTAVSLKIQRLKD